VEPSTEERKEIGALPQHYADMHGWHAIVRTAARVYENLAPEARSRAALWAPNYGVAGAIDFIGPSTDCRPLSALTITIGSGGREMPMGL
jgi:hypothetical protein